MKGTDMGALGRARASVSAVETLARIRREARTVATDGERVALSGWSGWGPLAKVFAPEDNAWADLRDRLEQALPEADFKVGMRGTYNAFYTPRPIAAAMWRMLAAFGFTGGQVAELGCGGGAFFGTAPDGVSLVGVERDPTAAAICELLYPQARVVRARLQDVSVGSGAAAVIGNVPFGDVRVHDATAPKEVTANLHNYFLWRAVRAVAPGGFVCVLTSRFSMDSDGADARMTIAKEAALVGAIRLPNGALAGGTEAGADILILRRHHGKPGQTGITGWQNVRYDSGTDLSYNEWWHNEPGSVLGLQVKGQTNQYGMGLQVEATGGDVAEQALAYVRGELVPQARDRNLMWVPPPAPEKLDVSGVISREGWHEGSMRLTDTGGVLVVKHGVANPLPRPGRELLALLRLRDLAVRLMAAEADHSRPDASIEPLRADTRAAYEAYVKQFGALNRYKQRPDGVDAETGIEQWKRIYPTMQGFRHDPDSALVFALEVYADEDDGDTDDDETGTGKASPAPILTSRQNRPRPARVRTDDPQQALAWCLDEHGGRVELEYIGALLFGEGRENLDDVAALLGDKVFLDPATRVWLTAEEYLSGNVRAKHAVAVQAAEHDPRFVRNVAGLEKVLPPWLGPGDITINLGSPMLSPQIVEKFAAEVLGSTVVVRRVAVGNQWEVAEVSKLMRSGVAATATWGTPDVDGFTLLEKALNYKIPVVYRVVGDGDGGTTVKDVDATLLAVQKQQELRARFGEWLWEDPDRAAYFENLFNTRFNNLVPRTFDGSHITVDGVADWFKPYPHQLDMVARAIATGATICGHCVGAGKTYSMGLIVAKLKQLGLVRKPMLVVPNHMIEQVDRELRQLLPAAKILTGASKTVSRNRRAFTARCATQDWDIVLVTHSAFNAMGVDPETERIYIEQQQDELHEAVVGASADGKLAGRMVKNLAKRLDRLAAKVAELRDKVFPRDAGVRFDQLGVDYVCIDEFHYYKNLALPVRTDGFSVKPSQRATDLDMKLRYLSERGSGRYAALFSGTPMSNTMLELYVCMHYTMLPYLRSIGIGSADAWAAAFVQFQTTVEVTVDGGDFRMHTRPSLFVNARQLRVMLSQVADIRTREQLGLKVPAHELIIEACEPTDQTAAYSLDLVSRAEKARAQGGRALKGADNMLKICGDGRRMATDPALVGIDDDGRTKLNVVAERIVETWQAHPGKLQMAFCDIGTPYDPKAREAARKRQARKNDEFYGDDGLDLSDWGELGGDLASELGSLFGREPERKPRVKAEPVQLDYQTYGRLRRILVDAGMDVRRIRFIHDAKTDGEKAQLFRDCRRGKVDVIIGSTDKLGVGTNIQRLVVAMHHIDAPFRPADVEQRDGRGLRPGNLNKLVWIFRYVTKRTFDAYMWQMLHRKLTFIAQMLSGDVGQVVEDITDDGVMSFGAIKAAATDQPLLQEKTEIEAAIKQLRIGQRWHRTTIERAKRDVPRMLRDADTKAAAATAYETIAAHADGVDLTDDLLDRIHQQMQRFSQFGRPRVRLTDELRLEWGERIVENAFGLQAERQPRLVLVAGDHSVDEPAYRWWKPADLRRKVTKLLDNAGEAAAKLRLAEALHRTEAVRLQAEAERPFGRADELTAALARLDQINAELADAATRKKGPGADDIVIPAPAPAEVENDEDLLAGLGDLFGEMQATVDADLESDLANLFG